MRPTVNNAPLHFLQGASNLFINTRVWQRCHQASHPGCVLLCPARLLPTLSCRHHHYTGDDQNSRPQPAWCSSARSRWATPHHANHLPATKKGQTTAKTASASKRRTHCLVLTLSCPADPCIVHPVSQQWCPHFVANVALMPHAANLPL